MKFIAFKFERENQSTGSEGQDHDPNEKSEHKD